jgi:hypothetical protein
VLVHVVGGVCRGGMFQIVIASQPLSHVWRFISVQRRCLKLKVSVCLGSLKKQSIVPGDVTSHVTTELFVPQPPTDVKLIDTDCGI